MPKKRTFEEFVKMANEIHENKYEYDEESFNEKGEKIKIICPIHGEFEQTKSNHLKGKGCSKCYGNKKITTEEYIEKAIKIHGNKYDYSKVDYKGDGEKICIICPIHGEFNMIASNHINKNHPANCPKCSHRSYKKTTNEFIEEAKKVHGERYDYSKVKYINNKTEVCIICKEHGEFFQKPIYHLRGSGCPTCNKPKFNVIRKTPLMTTNEFIEKANKIHNNKYDYSKVSYKGTKIKVRIICPIHGEFLQKPNNHLNGQGCPKCGFEKERKRNVKWTFEKFIEESNKIHENKYDYSKSEWINRDTKLKIICPIHGEFEQTPRNHLNGQGCPKCGYEKLSELSRKSVDEFINEAIEVHGYKYDYSKVEYINNKTKVKIVCPIHGEFEQVPSFHLNGQGCPKCKTSHLENEIMTLLEENNIDYIYQYKNKWLETQSLDFYIPKYNIAIECQGEQHYKPIDFAGRGFKWAERQFEYIKVLDTIKRDKCSENGIKLLYFARCEYKDNIITDKEKLIEEIKSLSYD